MDLEAVAIIMLKRGQQLPLDMAYRLMERGIDVTALEAKYGV
jgi:hypothetical protein